MSRTAKLPAASSHPPHSRWRAVLAAFWEGSTTSSVLGGIAMLAGFCLTTLFALWFFSTASLIGPNGDYLARSGRDAEAFATVSALRVGNDRGSAPMLLVVGTSTLAQAIGSGDTLIQKFRDAGLSNWQLQMLTTPLQSPLDQFALLETALQGQTKTSAPVLVLIGVGPTRPGWVPERQLEKTFSGRLGITSKWERAERQMMGETLSTLSGFNLIDNRKFFILNGTEAMLRYLLQAPAHRRIDSYADDNANPKAAPNVAESILQLPNRMTHYLDQTKRLIARIQGIPGVKVILIEEPLEPDFIEAQGLSEEVTFFFEQLQGEALRLNVPYIPVVKVAALSNDDYHDILHLKQGLGQVKYQIALAKELTSLLEIETKP